MLPLNLTIAIVILDLFASIKTKSFGDKLSLLGVHKNEFPKVGCFTILENASSATAIYTDVIYDKKCETGNRISLRQGIMSFPALQLAF